MKKSFFLIDAYTIIFRSYYAFIKNPRINSKGMNTSVIFGFVNILNDILNTEHPDYIVAAFDGDRPSFRAEIYPQYKANRPPAPEDIKKSIPYIKQLLDAYNIKYIQKEPYEADDIIGSLAKKYNSSETIIYMATTDKDFVQLLDEYIYLFKPRSRSAGYEKIDKSTALKKYGLQTPLQFIDFLALMGDAADNIPGAKGIGEKTAVKLLQQFDSIENIYANIDAVEKRYRQKLLDSKEAVFLSKELATIKTDIPLEYNLQYFSAKPPNKEELISLYKELEFRTLLNKLSTPQSSSLFNIQYSKNENDLRENSEEETKQIKTIDTTEHRYILVTTPERIDEICNKIQKEKHFAFDTETTSVNAVEATPLGISFSIYPHEAYYLPLDKNPNIVEYFKTKCKQLFSDNDIIKIAHNLKYDKIILSHLGIDISQPYFDTMIAHYLIDPDQRHNMDTLSEKYLNYQPISLESLIGKKGKSQKSVSSIPLHILKDYAAEDADVTLQLKHTLEPILKKENLSELFHSIEIPLIDVLTQMELTGVTLDTSTLQEIKTELKSKIATLEKEIYDMAREEFNISSTQQLGKILFEKLKISTNPKLTKTKQYSTSEETLKKLKTKHPIINNILKYRTLVKLLNTYIDTLPDLINPKTGKIHTTYNQTVANTGRLSSNNPNLQNIPIRDEIGRLIRKAFVPSTNENLFISADYSQIELRIMAHFSEDNHLIQAFIEDKDIHTATAAKIYKVPIEDVTPEMRKRAKVANFGIIYGISAFGLAERLEISRKEAKQLIDGYFENFPEVKQYIEKAIAQARDNGYVETLFGRKKSLPDINSRNHITRSYAERIAVNMPIQGTAADIIKKAMIDIHNEMIKQKLKSKMIIQVHDELCFDVTPYEKKILIKIIKEKMENVTTLKVPLKVDIGIGKNWLEAH